MNAAPDDPATLLDELANLPPDDRLPRLERDGADLTAQLLALGDVSEQLAAVEIARSLAATELVIDLADAAGIGIARARARRARTMALAYAGRFHDALLASAPALAIAESEQLPVEAARARLASINALASLGRFADAIASGDAARDGLLAAGEPALAARADVNLGVTYDMQGDPSRALIHYDRARAGLAGDPVALAQLETNRGTALQWLGRFAEAEAAFLAAGEAFSASGLGWAVAIAEGNLAHLSARQGRLERALHHFERARRQLESDESPAQLARVLAETAQTLTQLGMREEAIGLYRRVVPELDALGFAPEAATARFGLGQALGETGALAEAETVLTGAADAFAHLEQPVMRARVDVARAVLASAGGRPDQAEMLLADAEDVLEDRPVDLVAVRFHQARLALDSGDVTTAEAYLAEAVPLAESFDLGPMLADLLQLRARLAVARGQVPAALADLRLAVARIERIRGALQAERFRAVFLGNRLGAYEALVSLLVTQVEPDATAEAFAVVEQAKSRALLDTVTGALDLRDATRAATDPAETALLVELDRLSAEVNWYYSRLEPDGDGTEPVSDAAHPIREREQALAALQDRIAAGRGVAGLYATPLGLDAVQARIAPDAALVEYFLAGDELLAFVVRCDTVTVLRNLATRDEMPDLARQIRFQISRAIAAGSGAQSGPRADRLLRDARRALGAAHAAIMAPVMAAIGEGVTRLSVVPHGPLHMIPFPALWDGERFLIEHFELHVSPSASLLGLTGTATDAPTPPRATVIGVEDELAPQIRAEAERVAEVLAAERVLLGPDATIERVVDAATGAGVVHLACHGRFVPDSPLASGLKLADGWLTARHIYTLRLGVRLVTLSGCDTGRSAVGGGDELTGLLRSFVAAGAASVVMSLWTVNDESTADLMTDFYAAWRAGEDAATALQHAQLRGLAARPHPVYWAPFLVGGKAG